MAISNFLARRFGFHGSTDVEVLEVDQVLGIVGDIVAAFVRLLAEKDEERKLGYADVAAFEILDATTDQSMVDRFPLVKANAEMVKANKRIAEWLAKRPLTRM